MFDEDAVGPRSGGKPQRVKKQKIPKFPIGVWVQSDAGTEFAMWVRTVANLPDGRVACVLRSGTPIIIARSYLSEPVKRKRPRR